MAKPPVNRLVKRIASGSIINLGIRGATLFLRFALSFYIVSYLGLKAAGIYGLAVGTVGLAPACLGWGLNYHVGRHVVGQAPNDAITLIRNRIIITLGSLIALSCIAVPLIALAPPDLRPLYYLILILVWFETIALDIYMPMIGLEMTVQANVMVFIRSAAWIPIVAALGIWSPYFRTLNVIFGSWIISHLFALALLPFFLRHWPVGSGLKSPFDGAWARKRITRFWYIYVSDISVVGLVYLDRYIVSFLLGLAATGVYSFYWSITNALQTLMMTAVVQVALPHMVKAFRTADPAIWKGELRHQTIKTLSFAVVLALAIFMLTEMIIQLSPPGRFPQFHALLVLLLLASVVRSCSDLLNVGITSSGNDRLYAITNFFGVVMTVGSSALLLWLFGLIGAGISALLTATLLLVIRYYCLRFVLRRVDSAQRTVADA